MKWKTRLIEFLVVASAIGFGSFLLAHGEGDTVYCVPPGNTTSSVYWYVQCMLPRYDVPPLEANWIFQHESQWDASRVGDLAFKCPRTGAISPSYGIAQINLCYHPELTKQAALDPSVAVPWTLKQLEAGNEGWWSTWRFRFQWFSLNR